jgi:hypothetical protein
MIGRQSSACGEVLGCHFGIQSAPHGLPPSEQHVTLSDDRFDKFAGPQVDDDATLLRYYSIVNRLQ